MFIDIQLKWNIGSLPLVRTCANSQIGGGTTIEFSLKCNSGGNTPDLCMHLKIPEHIRRLSIEVEPWRTSLWTCASMGYRNSSIDIQLKWNLGEHCSGHAGPVHISEDAGAH
jgi:hypothetical protein